ncbi:ribosome biogenesis protein bop1 [Thecamonas trahens ATCC 50062]|uniref:Ribosome biogenesis protein BOP1 homolog n=1 Tax=Thecamonas trahens ATCC 50062 TaxID=461836 RepID=A0A0L0DH21_THETB|nr:ribosome biogenesis protein bop1 [Thecamonas trahens ATCC 50062]KNC51639.1 ribosome biogenesis protein bop1 [Thecamonas trahens ATCC 50062]|eukprot:XP_013756033.1 ribosome biogenesis protein bop1 [Thecamonas trahens ATCC 50062]
MVKKRKRSGDKASGGPGDKPGKAKGSAKGKGQNKPAAKGKAAKGKAAKGKAAKGKAAKGKAAWAEMVKKRKRSGDKASGGPGDKPGKAKGSAKGKGQNKPAAKGKAAKGKAAKGKAAKGKAAKDPKGPKGPKGRKGRKGASKRKRSGASSISSEEEEPAEDDESAAFAQWKMTTGTEIDDDGEVSGELASGSGSGSGSDDMVHEGGEEDFLEGMTGGVLGDEEEDVPRFAKTGAIAAPLSALKPGGDMFLRALRERTRAGYRSALDYGAPVETYASEKQLNFLSKRDKSSAGIVAESSDDESDDDMHSRNTLGKIPLEWYDEYDHLGYDLDGKPIAKTGSGMDTIDDYIARTDDPEYWRRVYDDATQQNITLSVKEMEMLRRMQKGQFGDMSFDPYEDWEPFFSRHKMMHPVYNKMPNKAAFVPSKWEARKVAKMVRKIRSGRVKPKNEVKAPEVFDAWADEDANQSLRTLNQLSAPKMQLPTNAESYNPPAEYVFDEEGKASSKAMPHGMRSLKPQKYSALRHVPAYKDFYRERYERCLDLTFCPRSRKVNSRVRIAKLLPKVPDPRELRPFPTRLSLTFRGHTSKVRSISVHPSGQYLLSGSNDGSVRLWEVATGRCLRKWSFAGETVVYCVEWSPAAATRACLAAVTTGSAIYIIAPLDIASPALRADTMAMLSSGLADLEVEGTFEHTKRPKRKSARDSDDESDNDDDDASTASSSVSGEDAPLDDDDVGASGKGPAADADLKPVRDQDAHQVPKAGHDRLKTARWEQTSARKVKQGVFLRIAMPSPVLSLAWHAKGDYLASVSPKAAGRNAVFIHQVSSKRSLTPFAGRGGFVQRIRWHPSKPLLFVATHSEIRVYNLTQQKLIRRLKVTGSYISDMVIHPGGDNVLVGSFDKFAMWYDLDYSSRPYKTFKYHKLAVRSVAYSPRYPLFATCSDDNTIQVFHGRVYADMLSSPLIVPVKILAGHKVVDSIGVIDITFHPTQPWIFSAGADGLINLFT